MPPAATVRRKPRATVRGPSVGLIVGSIVLAVVVLGGGLTALALSGALDGLVGAPRLAGGLQEAAGAAPTLPPTWTPTPSATIGPSPSATQPTSPDAAAQSLESDLAALARLQMSVQNYRRAIVTWGEIINQSPGDLEAYYGRAYSYLSVTDRPASWDEFARYSQAALADLEQAFALSPAASGDHYLARAWAFENLGSAADLRVDHDRLIEISLENLRAGLSLPHDNPLSAYDAARLLLRLGRCDEAMQEIERLDTERGAGLAPSPQLLYYRGVALICMGRYQEAWDALHASADLEFNCETEYQLALAYYLLGRIDDMFWNLYNATMDCVSQQGHGNYFQALVMYEVNQMGRAHSSLDKGFRESGDPWELKAYVEGLMLAEEGKREEAIGRLQQAELTLLPIRGPFLDRIRRELAALGGSRVVATPMAAPAATPIPPLPAGHPTPAPIRRVLHNQGSGELQLAPGERLLLHFRGPAGFTISSARQLHIHLLPATAAAEPGLELQLFDVDKRRWEDFSPRWGQNVIDAPDRFFYGSGDLFIRLHNPGQSSVSIYDVGLDLSVIDDYGEHVRWSFLDS